MVEHGSESGGVERVAVEDEELEDGPSLEPDDEEDAVADESARGGDLDGEDVCRAPPITQESVNHAETISSTSDNVLYVTYPPRRTTSLNSTRTILKKRTNQMKKIFVAIFLLCGGAMLFLAAAEAEAENIFRIEIGGDYERYSDKELRKRVWELEKAVWQLQQRTYSLESAKPDEEDNSWTCYIQSFGETFRHTSASKSLSQAHVIDACSKENHAMHCKDSAVKCGQ